MNSLNRSWRWSAAAFVAAAVVLFPFYWMVTTALRKETSVFAYPPNLLPTDLSPGLLFAVLWKTDVVRWLLNTGFIAGTATLIVLPIAGPYRLCLGTTDRPRRLARPRCSSWSPR